MKWSTNRNQLLDSTELDQLTQVFGTLPHGRNQTSEAQEKLYTLAVRTVNKCIESHGEKRSIMEGLTA